MFWESTMLRYLSYKQQEQKLSLNKIGNLLAYKIKKSKASSMTKSTGSKKIVFFSWLRFLSWLYSL